MVDSIPEKTDFEKALNDWFLEAEKEENPFVDIRADDLHARIGDYPGPLHRMATCWCPHRTSHRTNMAWSSTIS